jgi:hypothetical protein
MLIYILIVAFSYPVQNAHLLNYSSPLHLLTPKKNRPMLAGPGHLLIVLSCSWHTSRGSYIICVFLLVSPFFSLFNSFSEEMDLWGSFGDCTHFVDRILRISHTKQFQSCQRQLSLLGFIQFVTIDDLLFSFPFGSLVLRYFEDSLWISYIIPLPFLPHE